MRVLRHIPERGAVMTLVRWWCFLGFGLLLAFYTIELMAVAA